MTDARTAFIQAATWHGDLEDAEVQLHRHPELRSSDIHTAAILGDAAAVERFLAADRGSVKAKSPEHLGLLGREEGIASMAVIAVEVP